LDAAGPRVSVMRPITPSSWFVNCIQMPSTACTIP